MSSVLRAACLFSFGFVVGCPKDPPILPPANCISEGLCYQGAVAISVGEDPLSVEMGDLDGDGDLDAVSVNVDTISVLKNVNGLLQAPQNFGVGVQLSSATLGDIDDDGDLDLVTAALDANNITQILSFRNDGAGSFSPFGGAATSDRAASFVALGDLDGDGSLDVVTPVFGRALEIYLNNGSGQFAAPVEIGTDVGNAADVADLNDDGLQDIVVSDFGGGQVHILFNTGNTQFSAPTIISVGSGPRIVVAADLNGDGLPEIITPNTTEQKIGILRNQGGGFFASAEKISLPAPVFSVEAADLDGDGLNDLATSNFTSNSATLIRNLGQNQFGTPVVFDVPGNPFTVAAGDLNTDGLAEVLFSCVLDDTLSFLPASATPD